MIIGIAGPFYADTVAERLNNLETMNRVAALLLEKGHIPLIGLNAALPVVEMANISNRHKAIMDITLAVISACEALYLIEESLDACMERDFVLSKGLPVYYHIDDIPD